MEDYQQKVNKVALAYEVTRSFFSTVAPVAGEIYERGGQKALKEFTSDVRDALGTDDVSYSTLENYAWIHNRLKGSDPAEDWSINALQKIASIKDDDKRKQFVKLARDKGLSSKEIIYKLKYK